VVKEILNKVNHVRYSYNSGLQILYAHLLEDISK